MKSLTRCVVLMVVAGARLASAHGIHDISVTMTSPAYVAVGTSFTYAIGVANGGLGDPAYGIVAILKLPPKVTFHEVDGGPFSCTRSGTTLTCSAEQIDWGVTTITVEVVAPPLGAQLVSSVEVVSIGTIDSSPYNNTDSGLTRAFDPVACQSATPRLLRPEPDTSARSPLMLQWSSGLASPFYYVYVTQGTTAGQRIAATQEASVSVDLPPGPVEWYVEARSDECPTTLTSPLGRFTVLGATAASRRRAVGH